MSVNHIYIEPISPDAGVCLMVPAAEFNSGISCTITVTSHTIYSVIESAVNSFTTVIYSMIRNVSNRIKKLNQFFRSEKFLFRARIAKLAYAGGLRL